MGVPPTKHVYKDGSTVQTAVPGIYPSVYTMTQSQGMTPSNNLVLVGEALSGPEGEIVYYKDYEKAKMVLKGGPLLEALEYALSPNNKVRPDQVGIYKANIATKASRQLLNGVDAIFDVTSKEASLAANAIGFSIEQGASYAADAPTYLITETNGAPVTVADDQANPLFTIQYLGTGTACTMTITSGTLTTTITGASSGEPDLSIDFNMFAGIDPLTGAPAYSLQRLINHINDVAGPSIYNVVIDPAADPDFPVTKMDIQTAVDIMSSPITVRGDVEMILQLVNSTYTLIDIAMASGSTRVMPDLDTAGDNVLLSGGDNGTPMIVGDWEDALEYLETQPINILVPITGDAAIHAMFDAHCQKMSSPTGKKYRQCICGGVAEETISTVITRAKAINSSYTMLVHQEFVPSVNPTIGYRPPYYMAALLGGLAASYSITTPLTYKQINVASLKMTLTRAQTDELIQGGVCTQFLDDEGVFKVVRSVTTYQRDDFIRNEWSPMRTLCWITNDLTYMLERRFIGRAGLATTYKEMTMAFEEKLQTYVGLDYLAKDPSGALPSYQIKNFSVGQDVVVMEWVGLLPAPINFGFVENNFTVTSKQTSTV